MRVGNWEAGIHSAIGRDVSVGSHGSSILVPCKGCGNTITVELNKSVPPQGVRRMLEHVGWRLGARRKCPDCNAPRAHQEKEESMVETPPKLSVVGTDPAKPTDAARAMRRAVLQWLEESFDPSKGRYTAGISDASIAKETGAAVATVKALREEFYGPISEPTEMQAVRDELAAIRREGKEARAEFDTKISALGGRATALEQKLTRIATANGWQS